MSKTKWVILLLSIGLLATSIMLVLQLFPEKAAAVEPDFRNVRWGMNVKQVERAETAVLFSSEFESDDLSGQLIYRDSILGYDVNIHYNFDEDGRLYSVGYGFYSIENKTMDDYLIVVSLYKEKYGDPYMVDDVYEADIEVTHVAKWKAKTTDITVSLHRLKLESGDTITIFAEYKPLVDPI